MSDYRAPIWPYPVTAIGVMFAVVYSAFWMSSGTVPPQQTVVTVSQDGVITTTSALNVSVMDRERLECDRQVALLMNTKDPVELERAKFLIAQFNCAIGRRLPPP